MKLNFLGIFLTYLFILNNISCVYRQEAYKIFDKFTLVDLVKYKIDNYFH